MVNNHVGVDINVELNPHGQRWVNCGGPMTIDANLCNAYVLPTVIDISDDNVHGQEYRAVDYFYVMFPMRFLIAKMLPYTNQELLVKRRAVTTEGELLKFFGITLAMAIDPCRGGIQAYWESGNSYETTLSGRNYGVRFGMSRHRFLELRSYLRCTPRVVQEDVQIIVENGIEQDKDPWYHIRPFVAAFNGCRKS